ncbi:uncharacterized protein N7515_005673 [Penicillium bovifimosum]|uniref:Uncharacterized protein n=1 Tax=Penicillium bovifimosum TaxID=126998 RepID=A0A9W9L026_9EURO|nr:uncharacterized protein N7515_005673 [Penicillium bovifimosum]KAJ5129634.1 hypothetical protein N7515_005673 [Penicillium bovifimosum]
MTSTGYHCGFPGCNAGYQRKGHLRRHEAQHREGRALQCSTCTQVFHRRDTLRRHVQTVHGIAEPAAQLKQACTHCRNQKIRCDGGPPCTNCQRRGIQCSLARQAEVVQPGPSPNNALDTRWTRQGFLRLPPRMRRSEIEDRFVGRYFDLFHPHWPFIHQGTFTEYETPLLIQSMVVIGMWMTDEEETRCQAINLHKVLGDAIRQQTEHWDGSLSEAPCASSSWPIPTYQAILLHIISAGMIRGSGSLLPDLKPSLTAPDADLLQRFVASCKKLGMFYYPNILARHPKNQPAAYIWVSIEEIKRFNLTLFKVCKSFSGLSRQRRDLDGLIDDREKTVSWGLSARDLQFPLPRNAPLWNALNPEEWFAADTENVYRHGPGDILEQAWISWSADVLDDLTES